jgi:uncharacterized membrane protein
MHKLKKAKLNEAVTIRKGKTKRVLELIKSELNQGQFKKLMKNDEVREFFALYGVTEE